MATRLLVDVILTLSDLNIAPADMDAPFAMPGPGDLRRHEGRDTTIEDLPDEILAKSLLGMEPPFSRRRICKQLRSLFDNGLTHLHIQDQEPLLPDLPDPASGLGDPDWHKGSSELVFQHDYLLSLLRRLPHLDTLLDLDGCRGKALPWEEMGQILGGQLTRLIFHCNWKVVSFLELFPSLRRLEVLRNSLMTAPTLELQPLSALRALQHLELRGLPVRDLGPLASCSRLQFLDLGGCPIEDLGPLVKCTELRTLKLSGIDTLRDLGPLGSCASLQRLELSNCRGVTRLKPLELCTNLLFLDLTLSRATDFEALSGCTALQHLRLFGCAHLHSLAPLASCRKLQLLDIGSNIIPSLEPIWELQELQHLYLWHTQASRLGETPPELGPLTRVKHLQLNFPYGFAEGL